MALQVNIIQLQLNKVYLQCLLHSDASDHTFVLLNGNLCRTTTCLMHDEAFNVRHSAQSLQAYEVHSSGHVFGSVHPER